MNPCHWTLHFLNRCFDGGYSCFADTSVLFYQSPSILFLGSITYPIHRHKSCKSLSLYIQAQAFISSIGRQSFHVQPRKRSLHLVYRLYLIKRECTPHVKDTQELILHYSDEHRIWICIIKLTKKTAGITDWTTYTINCSAQDEKYGRASHF